jgi:hypothetical protein
LTAFDYALIVIRLPLLVWLGIEVFRVTLGLGLAAVDGIGVTATRTRFARLSNRRVLRKHAVRTGVLLGALALTLLVQVLLLELV